MCCIYSYLTFLQKHLKKFVDSFSAAQWFLINLLLHLEYVLIFVFFMLNYIFSVQHLLVSRQSLRSTLILLMLESLMMNLGILKYVIVDILLK